MLIEVTDRDEAIAIAARGAVARVGTIEIRPVREGPPPNRLHPEQRAGNGTRYPARTWTRSTSLAATNATTTAATHARDRHPGMMRVLDAPRDLVFQALTEPERLRRWWGPHGFTVTGP